MRYVADSNAGNMLDMDCIGFGNIIVSRQNSISYER